MMQKASKALSKVVLAAVPEQVNIPLQICIEKGLFLKHGIEVEHRVVPEGTGRMLDLLEEGVVDVALTVTDGFIVGKANGRKVKLIGTFVESPLVWAVVGPPAPLSSTTSSSPTQATATATSTAVGASTTASATATGDVVSNGKQPVPGVATTLHPSHLGRACRFGISRLGSGSHTMAHYASSLHAIDSIQPSQFVVANNFAGLKAGVKDGSFDAFMWETFTTKPSVDSGELSLIDEVPTPWTAFSFVTSISASSLGNPLHSTTGEVIGLTEEKETAITKGLFPALDEAARIFKGLKAGGGAVEKEGVKEEEKEVEESIRRISREFGHTEEDARLWFSRCSYALGTATQPPMAIDIARTEKSVEILKQVGLVKPDFQTELLWRD